MKRKDMLNIIDAYSKSTEPKKGEVLKNKLIEYIEDQPGMLFNEPELVNNIALLAEPNDLRHILYLIVSYTNINHSLSNEQKKNQLDKMIEKYSIEMIIEESKYLGNYLVGSFENYMLGLNDDYLMLYGDSLINSEVIYIKQKNKSFREALIDFSIEKGNHEKKLFNEIMNNTENCERLMDVFLYLDSKDKDFFQYFKGKDINEEDREVFSKIANLTNGYNITDKEGTTDRQKEYAKYIVSKIEKYNIPVTVLFNIKEKSIKEGHFINRNFAEEFVNYTFKKNFECAKNYLDSFKEMNPAIINEYISMIEKIELKEKTSSILINKTNKNKRI